MDFPANFRQLSQKFGEDKENEMCTILEELVTQSKLLENRLSVSLNHIEILQAVITNSVTRYGEANGDISGEEVTAKCLKLSLTLARNLCAGVERNQAMLCDSMVPDMAVKLMDATNGKTSILTGFETIALQLLGNLCVGFTSGQDKVWSLLYPNILYNVLCEESVSVLEACHMIIHNCTIEHPNRMRLVCTDKKMVDFLWGKILSGKCSGQEWGLLLLEHVIIGGFVEDLYSALELDHNQLHLVLLECALEKLDDHNSCVVPEQLTEQNSTCCMRENDVIFLAAKFRCCMSTISNDLSRLDKSCKTLRLLLQLVNTLSIQANHLKILHRMPQLLESTVEFLRVLCIYDGTVDSAKNRTNLRDLTTAENSNDQLFGLKRDLIRLIGNLCYQHQDNQDKMRHLDAIVLLLNHFSIDCANPYIQQWTTWAVRNVCAGNEENQRVIKALENHGLADNEAIASLPGLEVEVCDDGKLRTKHK